MAHFPDLILVADDYDCALSRFTRGVIKGCVMASCRECQSAILVSPAQQKLQRLKPDAPLICRGCFRGFNYIPFVEFNNNDMINRMRTTAICVN